ncbi:hypothetical protein J6590_044316 [Homalodisca vitripennis]|nr:hypothetical protein J6590_044316 [Homalodisca vitripennis]
MTFSGGLAGVSNFRCFEGTRGGGFNLAHQFARSRSRHITTYKKARYKVQHRIQYYENYNHGVVETQWDRLNENWTCAEVTRKCNNRSKLNQEWQQPCQKGRCSHTDHIKLRGVRGAGWFCRLPFTSRETLTSKPALEILSAVAVLLRITSRRDRGREGRHLIRRDAPCADSEVLMGGLEPDFCGNPSIEINRYEPIAEVGWPSTSFKICVLSVPSWLVEYPCDHYTAIINVTLMNTGCPRTHVHETALQLLQVLDKRFFGAVGPLPAEGDTGQGQGLVSQGCGDQIYLVIED